jgi:plastocyanin
MRRQLLRASALAVGLACVSSCGGGSGSPTSPTPGGNTMTITIMRQNGTQSFSPNPATAGGRTVVFRNADSVVHRVLLNDGVVDTGDIAPGATSGAIEMPSAGANYHCSIHPDMVGAVSGSSGTPPPCDGPYCGDGGINY